MKKITKNLRFTTVVFLAGADQNVAELRVPSIRGALRWWFRVLGGTKDEEFELFGGCQSKKDKEEKSKASQIVLRITNEAIIPADEAFDYRRDDPRNYLLHFAKISGNDKNIYRTHSGAFINKGTTFTLEVIERFKIRDELWKKFEDALNAFCHLGALGLRATRGYGMVAETPLPTAESFRNWAKSITSKRDDVYIFELKEDKLKKGKDAHSQLAEFLREIRKTKDYQQKRYSPKNESAKLLGSSTPRMASALRLCPVATEKEGIIPIIFYTEQTCDMTTERVDSLIMLLRNHPNLTELK